MQKLKINFADFYDDFDVQKNFITQILARRYELEISEQPDFLFYSCFGTESYKYKNCVKIFYTGEVMVPDFNECDYAIGFDYIEFGERYLRQTYHSWDLTPALQSKTDLNRDLATRKFCNFIYSNHSSGEGSILRQNFCKKLMEYKHVDCPGKCLHNMDDELFEREGKLPFLAQYKFTISFENSSSNGYTTEKLTHPLSVLSLPIYWGNPLVNKEFNPEAFINCNDYDNDFDRIIAKIIELDNDDEKYMEMLSQPAMQEDFNFDFMAKLENFLWNIVAKGNTPFNKDPRGWAAKRYVKVNRYLSLKEYFCQYIVGYYRYKLLSKVTVGAMRARYERKCKQITASC